MRRKFLKSRAEGDQAKLARGRATEPKPASLAVQTDSTASVDTMTETEIQKRTLMEEAKRRKREKTHALNTCCMVSTIAIF